MRKRMNPAVGKEYGSLASIWPAFAWALVKAASSVRKRNTGEVGAALKSPQTTNGWPRAWRRTNAASVRASCS